MSSDLVRTIGEVASVWRPPPEPGPDPDEPVTFVCGLCPDDERRFRWVGPVAEGRARLAAHRLARHGVEPGRARPDTTT